jgi:hypothetical protein
MALGIPQYFSGLQKRNSRSILGDLVQPTTPDTNTNRVFSPFSSIRLPVELCKAVAGDLLCTARGQRVYQTYTLTSQVPQTRGTWRLLVPFRQDLLLISNLSLGTFDSPSRNCIRHGCSGPRANGIFSSLGHSGANRNATAFRLNSQEQSSLFVHQKLGKNRGPTGFHDRLPAHKSATLFRVLHYCDRSSAWCSGTIQGPQKMRRCSQLEPVWIPARL